MVAVIVDQALGIAKQVTVALQAGIEIVGIGIDPLGDARIDDLDPGTVEIDAVAFRRIAHAVLATEQQRGAQPLIGIGDGSAHHQHFLAFGKDDAFRLAAHPLVDALQGGGDRVAAGGKLAAIGFEIGDRLARDAGFHGRLGDGHRDRRDQPRIERHGDDVFAPEARPVALIGGGDIIRHILLGKAWPALRPPQSSSRR